MSTWTLLLLITITWLLWAVGTLYAHYLAEKEGREKTNSGVSLAPIIPVFPLVFFAIAKVTDRFIPPWGTRITVGLHVLLLTIFVCAILWEIIRHRRRRSSM